MTTYYEIFFDSPELNAFWGTSETTLGNDTYELCTQTYYVAVEDDDMIALSIDPERGISDNEEMALYLSEFQYERPGCDADLLNCVTDDTREHIFAFHEVDKDEFSFATGLI